MVSKPDHAVRTLEFSPWINEFMGVFCPFMCCFSECRSRGCNWEQGKKDEFEIAPGTWTSNTSSSPSPRDATLAPLASLTTCSLLPKSIFKRSFCSSSSSWVDKNVGSLHRQTTRSRAWIFAKYKNAASLMATFRPPICGAFAARGVPSNFFSLLKRRYQTSELT